MREITKEAAENLYENALKGTLERAFEAVMAEIKELPDGVYGQYATNALRNLVQLAAKGVADLNVLLTEYLNTSDTLYANYEESFLEIQRLEQAADTEKLERDRLYEDYQRKLLAYEALKGGDDHDGIRSN